MANLNINLLPDALSGDGKTAKLKNSINKFLISGIVVFVLGSLVASSLLFFLSIQLRDLKNERAQAEVTVKNFEETEQKMFFLQDRVNKLKIIRSSDILSSGVAGFTAILDTLPSGSIVREASMDGTSINTIIEIKDSASLTVFLSQIITKDFKRINLKDFSFNPSTGYSMTMVYYLN